MRRAQRKWITYSALAAAAAVLLVVLISDGSRGRAAAEDRPFDVSGLGSYVSFKQGGYDEYLTRHADADRPSADIRISGGSFSRTEGMTAKVLDEFEGVSGQLAQTGDEGSMTWEVDVGQPGLYQIGLKYYTVKGKDSDIERELTIDGEAPFREAKSLIFNRVWKDESSKLERDGRGNDLTPKQAEAPMWREAWLKDATGYYEEPYLFYFSAGKHELTLSSIKEPLVIAELKLTNPDIAPSYDELANRYKEQGYRNAEGVLITVQGEAAVYKSDSMLAPYNDRSSPAVEPYHASKLRINAAGGWAWRMPGQWIEWEFETPEDGLYQIAFKNRQNYLTGMSSLRTLYIDDEIPFREAKRIGFAFDSAWQTKVLGRGEDDPYLFYLKKGRHSVRLEVTLGEIAPVVCTAENSILELNSIYRKIISYTGVVPDAFRDYALEKRIPEMADVFREHSDRL